MAHGISITEVATRSFAVRQSPSAIPFIVGVAPHDGTAGANEIVKCGSYKEFVDAFGDMESQDSALEWTLTRAAKVFFQLYGAAPIVAVNILESSDTASVTDEAQTFANDKITLANAHVSSVAVTTTDGLTTYTVDTDYTLDAAKGVITRLSGGSNSAGADVHVDYDHLDPTAATAADVVGGASGGVSTGLELIEEVYHQTKTVCNLILAPGFSHETSVAAAIAAKASGFSGGFKAFGLLDLDSSAASTDTVAEAVTGKHSTSQHVMICWPRVTISGTTDWLSAHAAGLIARTDRERGGGLPYASPSNKGLAIDGTEIVVTMPSGQTLNDAGLVTVVRREGFRLWNSRTAAYPGTTDVKDAWVPNRRMATHLENTLILSTFQKVDEPTNRRLIGTVVDTVNQLLNGWAARGALLQGSRVAFLDGDNPLSDLQNGTIRFRIYYAAPTPAEEIEFLLEVDTNLYDTLFA